METIPHLQREAQQNNESRFRSTGPLVNLNWPERIASIAAGTRLVSGGLKKLTSHPLRNTIMTLAGGYLLYRGLTGNCPLYARFEKKSIVKNPNINIKTTFTVNKPRQEVYDFWRKLENLPRFMTHLKTVQKIDEKRSHWEAKLPGDIVTISWNAEIVKDESGKLIGWRSVMGSGIDTAGKVEFNDAPANLGTELRVVITYHPPVGGIATRIAKLLTPVFENIVREDIRNFKQYIETGEVSITRGQSSGREKSSEMILICF